MHDVMSRIVPFGVALSVLAGCAAAADEITVRAAPGPYKPFAVFMSDQHTCGQLAHDQFAATSANVYRANKGVLRGCVGRGAGLCGKCR
jgi:hypothetical protein